MAKLTELPTELLLSIYERLKNIDDALHLARSCKLMHSVLDPINHRCSIFSHIIQNADHHKYDIRLDASETFCADFRQKHYTSNRPIPDSERPLFSDKLFGGNVPDPKRKKLNPDTVWSIVTRWHAMKELFNLYCDSKIRPAFLQSPFWQTLDHLRSFSQQAAYYRKPLTRPSGQKCTKILQMKQSEKMEAYVRFYRAISSHWLHINITWTAGVSRYTDFTACEDTFSHIKSLWLDDHERSSIHEKIEAIEVTDFVWGFLALSLFSDLDGPSSFAHHLRPDEFAHDPILWDLPADLSPYCRLARLGTFYFTPANIIELLLEMWTPDPTPQFAHSPDSCLVNKGLYLRRLGFFDRKMGTVENDNAHQDMVFAWFSTEILVMLEWWGMDRMLKDPGAHQMAYRHPDWVPYMLWHGHRTYSWEYKFRGQPILYQDSKEEIEKRIAGNR